MHIVCLACTCGKGLKAGLEEENRKLARTVQELQQRLDETTCTEGTKLVLNDFTALANELQKMLRLEVFSTVASDSDKSNILNEEKSVSDTDIFSV